jgi:hypothetical protein
MDAMAYLWRVSGTDNHGSKNDEMGCKVSASIEDLAHEISWLKNNFKQYIAGNTYNGMALTVSGFTTITRAWFIPYKTNNGNIFLRGYIAGSKPSAHNSTHTISGVQFKTFASPNYISGSTVTADVPVIWSFGSSGTGIWNINATAPCSVLAFSFDDELDSWPTWADVV